MRGMGNPQPFAEHKRIRDGEVGSHDSRAPWLLSSFFGGQTRCQAR